jgi:hypothetical protein
MQVKRTFPPLPPEMETQAFEKHCEILSSKISPFEEYDIVDHIISQHFPHGWAMMKKKDHRTRLHAAMANSACLESSSCRLVVPNRIGVNLKRGSGVLYAKIAYEKYMDSLQTKRLASPLPTLRACSVPDAGKYRIITIDSVNAKCLKPVQMALHAHLKSIPTFEFIGREYDGTMPAKPDGPSYKVLSIDYSNATDGVDGSFMVRLITEIIERSGSFELNCLLNVCIQELSLNRRIDNPSVGFYQRRGTLMGSLLSFPLLCLWNDSIIRKSGIRGHLICGDDAICYATEQQYNHWSFLSQQIGCKQTPGKSFFSNRFGSFCSIYNNGKKKIDHVNTGLFFAPLSGSCYNRIPEKFQPLYKKYCYFPKGEWRSLIGPTEVGGLGGMGEPHGRDRDSLRKAQLILKLRGRNYLNSKLIESTDSKQPYLTPFSAPKSLARKVPRDRIMYGQHDSRSYHFYDGFRDLVTPQERLVKGVPSKLFLSS